MTVLELIEKLGELDLRADVFTGPNADPVTAIEQFAGDKTYDLDPYVVIYAAGHLG